MGLGEYNHYLCYIIMIRKIIKNTKKDIEFV